jgi:phosphatidylserine/phosphatidylglycerophosphate/cardiolipin synthase-like enzyme
MPVSGQFTMPFAATLDEVISRHLDELRKPGVLSVRPGYQAAGGWLTQKPAIVVTVDQKSDLVGDRLPETVAGYAVDVRQAGPMQRLRASNPALYAAVYARAPEETLPPVFAFERDSAGQSLTAVNEAAAAARAPTKPQISYTAPDGASLEPMTDTFTITCHVSPDAGWRELQPFLTGVKTRLTVGMYDFTSAHILNTVTQALASQQTLNLVLDHPPKDRTADQTDEQTHGALAAALAGRLKFAWALEDHDPEVSAWIYPSAYHIKVAVRDGTSMWLSSGNWNNSNQPAIDPINDPAGAAGILATSDRDWHVIVEHPGLSKLFEEFLQNDLRVAAANQLSSAQIAAPGAPQGELVAPNPGVASRTPQQFFAPKTITATMKIQPVLTPDNYPQVILNLISSATQSLYLQIPYITPSDQPVGRVLAGLIAAIAAKIRAGLDVRIIMSAFETLGTLEQLQAAGIDNALVRIQNNLHAKGIIVDSAVVAVGSQNWSPPGVTTNRDATLVIFNDAAAQYWETIFLHDWANMATRHAAD